MNKINKGFQR